MKNDNLRIADVCGNIPALTRRYCLHNIEPIQPMEDDIWPRNVIEHVQRQVVDHLCTVRVEKEFTDGRDSICAIKGNNVLYVRDDLLAYGLAKVPLKH